jgi:hypothetical protein
MIPAVMQIQKYASKIKDALDGKISAVNNGILYGVCLISTSIPVYLGFEAQKSNFDRMDVIRTVSSLLIPIGLTWYKTYTRKLEKQATEQDKSIDDMVN